MPWRAANVAGSSPERSKAPRTSLASAALQRRLAASLVRVVVVGEETRCFMAPTVVGQTRGGHVTSGGGLADAYHSLPLERRLKRFICPEFLVPWSRHAHQEAFQRSDVSLLLSGEARVLQVQASRMLLEIERKLVCNADIVWKQIALQTRRLRQGLNAPLEPLDHFSVHPVAPLKGA